MIYPPDFESKIGFDQVRSGVQEHCVSAPGRKMVDKMRFSANYEKINRLLDQTSEMRDILLSGTSFPALYDFDPSEIFQRLKPLETFMESEELGELRFSLIIAGRVIAFISQDAPDQKKKYPVLFKLCDNLDVDREWIKNIDDILDGQNEVKDNASPALGQIRRKKLELERRAIVRIRAIFSQAQKQEWIASEDDLVLRNGRQVIPVTAAYKRKIKGVVHDQSSTGQTVYIEPGEVFEINNEITQLQVDERAEVIRILKTVADYFRPQLPLLQQVFRFLSIIDFIKAKANYAIDTLAMKPKLNPYPVMEWIHAKHPLLYLSLKKQGKEVVPLDHHLNKDQRIVTISGPNAGGKSVCLKTTGLLQYMLQCGMLVPMEDFSETGIFREIFIDIGDQQSIENDLSTYSSHLKNMKALLERAGQKTLFLIDEFGAGTEPVIGGAIAEAILMEMSAKKAMGVITTHYANLKIAAGKLNGVINGSMLFDTKNMKPLYQLKTGNPGSSFAFEIARSMGLPENILKTAGDLAGTEKVDFDIQLQNLELKKLELQEKEKQMRAGDSFLSEMIDKYEKLKSEIENNKKHIILEAKAEAKNIVSNANKLIEKTIREIRESEAEKEKTRFLRDQLRESESTLAKELKDSPDVYAVSKKKKKDKTPKTKEDIIVDHSPVAKGDTVRIKGQTLHGEIMDIAGKDANVAFGSVIMRTPLKKLEKIKIKGSKKKEKDVRVKYDFNINEKAADFNPKLDIRGDKVEDALMKARRFIDDAILLGVGSLKIIHGTGEGILREALRDYMRNIPEISKFRDEHPDRGGQGATLIELKK